MALSWRPCSSTPRTSRTSRATALAVVAAALVGLTAARPSAALTKNPLKILSPAVVPLTSPEIPNSLRGQYLWMGYPSMPAGWPGSDVYYRDQTYWGRLEPSRAAYSFAPLDDLLARAQAGGGTGGFRVMSYCPGCWMESRTDWPTVVPDWMPLQPGLTRRVPDWNSETFLSAWEQLMAALGQRYGNDPRLGWVDVGGYGKYGEWWIDTTGEGVPITDANRKRMVAAVVKAFPTKWVLINTMTDTTFTRWVLDTYPKTGMRTDGLGAPNMYSMIPVSPELQSYWKTRPIVTEWATTGDPVAGRDQVGQWHISTTSSANRVGGVEHRGAIVQAKLADCDLGCIDPIDLVVSKPVHVRRCQPWDVAIDPVVGFAAAGSVTRAHASELAEASHTPISANLEGPGQVGRDTGSRQAQHNLAPHCRESIFGGHDLGAAGGDDLVDADDAVVEEVRDPPLLLDRWDMDPQVLEPVRADVLDVGTRRHCCNLTRRMGVTCPPREESPIRDATPRP